MLPTLQNNTSLDSSYSDRHTDCSASGPALTCSLSTLFRVTQTRSFTSSGSREEGVERERVGDCFAERYMRGKNFLWYKNTVSEDFWPAP